MTSDNNQIDRIHDGLASNALTASLAEDECVMHDIAVVAVVGERERGGVSIDFAPAKLKRAEHLPLWGREFVRARLIPENLECVARGSNHNYKIIEFDDNEKKFTTYHEQCHLHRPGRTARP